eukprot:scaffold236753_cov18-Tisochrysis_lutea.AAC.1
MFKLWGRASSVGRSEVRAWVRAASSKASQVMSAGGTVQSKMHLEDEEDCLHFKVDTGQGCVCKGVITLSSL